jgi:RecA/RadA recombinase
MNLSKLIKLTGNQYGGIVSEGLKCGDVSGYVDTGSYILNALFSGSIFKGIAANKVSAFAGEEAVGKTYLLLSIIKQFLDKNPTGTAVVWDSESAHSKDMYVSMGIDASRVVVLPVLTVQEFRTQVLKILVDYLATPLKEREPMFFALDSLGNLSTTKEMEDSISGSETQDMTRARVIKATFRAITLKLGIAGIPMVFTNHGYFTQEMYPKFVPSGGQGLKYASSSTVFLSKRKNKDGDEVVGNIIRATVNKSRFTKQYSAGEMSLDFISGLDRYFGLLEIAEKYGIFKKVSTRYEMPDGKSVFGKQINANPEKYYTQAILDLIDAAVKKEFCFGEGEEPPAEDDELDIESGDAIDETAN